MTMQGSTQPPKRPLCVAAAVLLVVVVVLGLHWFFTGYRTFTQTKWDDHYSFEYPASLRQTVDNRVGVRFVGHLADGSEIVVAASVGVYPSPAARVEKTMSVKSRVLLDHSQAKIKGAPCEVLTFIEAKIAPLLVKSAFFEYNDRSWEFFVYSDPDHQEEVEALFQHVLDTFEVLP